MSGIARTVDSSAVPKRLLLVSLLLLAALVAALLWSDRSVARRKTRAVPAREGAVVPRDAEGPAAATDAKPDARLFGRVVDAETEAPVAGAAVTAYAFATARTLRATSAADGTFDFPDATAAGHAIQLVARREGFGAASLRVTVSDQPVLVRLRTGGILRGRVVSTEARGPVSPCRVSAFRCRPDDEPWDPHAARLQQLLPADLVVEATATTAADGRFEMTGLRRGPYALLVAAEGFAPRSFGDWNEKERVEIRAGAVAEVELVLSATAAFLVDVVDEATGEPLDAVRFEGVLRAERWSTLVPLAATVVDGVHVLRAGHGERGFESTWLRVSREGYAPRTLTFSGQKAGYRFVVALGRGGTILGHVRTSNEPTRGALVLVEWSSSVIGTAVTGPDGAFRIGPLVAGDELAVHAYDRALDPIAVVTLTLESGEEHVLEIGGPGIAVEGRVVVEGRPAANASVRVSGPRDSDAAATGRDGRYCVEGLAAGRHEIEVFADEGYFRRHVDLADGQRLRLDIDACSVIAGIVVDAETGAPLADAADLQMEVSALPVGSTGSNAVRVDRDGRFRIPVEPGVYELDVPESIELYVLERPRVDVTEASEAGAVTLRVVRDRQDGRITLDVKDGTTDEAVPEGDYDYWFRIVRGWGSFEDGVLEEEGLSLGTHRFRISSDAHAPTRVEITLTSDRRAVRQTVVLRPSEAIRVIELDRGGAGWVAGLRVGDVIRACNGRATASIAALDAALAEARGPVTIEFQRGGERKVATLSTNRIGAELENVLLGR